MPDSVAISDQEKALYFLDQNPQILQLDDPSRALYYENRRTDTNGNSYVSFSQQYQGVPVHASNIVVVLDADGHVTNISANYAPNLELSVMPNTRSRQAEETALQDFEADDGTLARSTTLQIYAPEVWSEDYPGVDLSVLRRLAWFVTVTSEGMENSRLYVVDAQDGEILERNELRLELAGKINLIIFEFPQRKEAWDVGVAVIKDQNGKYRELDAHSDSKGAYDNIKKAYQYFFDTFGRDSYDGKQALIRAYVTINCDGEAGWEPSGPYMDICRDWGTFPDVILHEYTHAVAGNMIGFHNPEDQRGLAVHEALGDIFAVFASNETGETLWQVNGPDNTIIRDLQNPQPGYPRRYDQRYGDRNILTRIKSTEFDLKRCPKQGDNYPDCGHANSIILSHATYLMSEGGDRGGSIPLQKLQYLYYSTLESGLFQSSSTLKQAAAAIYIRCRQIIGSSNFIKGKVVNDVFTAEDCRQVQRSFSTVDLMPPPSAAPPLALPEFPEIPSLRELVDSLRNQLRQALNDLLGDRSPLTLWQRFQDFIEELRNNYWIKLLECVKESDQACIEQYLTDLLKAILEGLLRALNEACSGVALVPIIILVLCSRKRVRK